MRLAELYGCFTHPKGTTGQGNKGRDWLWGGEGGERDSRHIKERQKADYRLLWRIMAELSPGGQGNNSLWQQPASQRKRKEESQCNADKAVFDAAVRTGK